MTDLAQPEVGTTSPLRKPNQRAHLAKKRHAIRTMVALMIATASGTAWSDVPQTRSGTTLVSTPLGWQCGAKEGSTPASESPKHAKTGSNRWCTAPTMKFVDGSVEVRFKPSPSRDDQVGGVVWRWQNGDKHYLARASALDNNLSLHYTSGGTLHTLRKVDAPIATNEWHRLRVEFKGSHIAVVLDGKRFIDTADAHILGTGGVGVWTDTRSATVFDEFRAAPAKTMP